MLPHRRSRRGEKKSRHYDSGRKSKLRDQRESRRKRIEQGRVSRRGRGKSASPVEYDADDPSLLRNYQVRFSPSTAADAIIEHEKETKELPNNIVDGEEKANGHAEDTNTNILEQNDSFDDVHHLGASPQRKHSSSRQPSTAVQDRINQFESKLGASSDASLSTEQLEGESPTKRLERMSRSLTNRKRSFQLKSGLNLVKSGSAAGNLNSPN